MARLHSKLGPLYLLVLQAVIVAAQVSVVNGVTQFAATPVSTNPAGVPTLVYNCAKTPALCENINQRNLLTRRNSRLTTLQGLSHIVLHFDSDGTRRESRNTAACPGTWRTTHPCPQANQPPTVPQGASVGSGSFAAMRYNPNNVLVGQAGFNTMARMVNGQPVDAGMMWTCDEFPPACTVEGGANAQTYCVPMSHGCAKPFGNPNPAETLSEQNFQSFATQVLRHRVWSSANPTGIFVFHFKTVFVDGASVYATYFELYDSSGGEVLDAYQKRSGSSSSRKVRKVMRDGIYTNGTIIRTEHYIDEAAQPVILMARQEDQSMGSNTSSVQQSFESLPKPPLLPVIEIQRDFIKDQTPELFNDTTSYIARVLEVTGNETLAANTNTTVKLSGGTKTAKRAPEPLHPRAAGRQCDPVTPCPDGSCCAKEGKCGFGKENCNENVCVSNCNATAFCGKDSLGGAVKCPLNVCCSAFGFCGVGDEFCIGTSATNVCQQGFGTCGTISPPTCGGRSAYARTHGCYQLSNVRDRQCNRITPAQIVTTGLTHLYAAFATIDPKHAHNCSCQRG